jgi:hypothetical protein
MISQNIVVCFPAGTGGHLIGALCSVLLGNTATFPDENGSMHSSVEHGFIHVNSSLAEDIIIREKLPNRDIIIGHFTNIDLLVEVGKKVIYITFAPDDVDEIVYRANKKTKVNLNDKNTYTLLAGVSWPTYEEFRAGAMLPINEQEWSVVARQYEYWKYTLPKNKENTLEITFDSINNSNTLVEQLASFLCIEIYNKDILTYMLNTYRQKNFRVH